MALKSSALATDHRSQRAHCDNTEALEKYEELEYEKASEILLNGNYCDCVFQILHDVVAPAHVPDDEEQQWYGGHCSHSVY